MSNPSGKPTSKPASEIPVVSRPPDYAQNIPQTVAAFYEQYGPIFRAEIPDFGSPIYLVGPEANRFVLSTNRLKFSHHIGWGQVLGVIPLFGNGLLTMDGDEHAQHRRMMNPGFTIAYMDRYLPIMNRVIRQYTADWHTRENVDVYEEARKITFDVAAETLAGLTSTYEISKYRDLFTAMIMVGMFVDSEAEYWKQVNEIKAELNALLTAKIRERRENPTDDVLGLLISARDEQGNVMSEEQIIAHANILLIAGHETSTSLSAWLLYLLASHPEYLQRVMEEQNTLVPGNTEPNLEQIKAMKVLENALSEAERLYPPVASGPRGVVEDFEFEGYHVPAGSFVFYSIAGSHYLPHIFADPLKFDPDRFAPPREEHKKVPYALVGFGGGARICLGINFAQVEIKAMASHIVRQYTMDVVPGQDLVQFYRPTAMPLNGIKMTFKQR